MDNVPCIGLTMSGYELSKLVCPFLYDYLFIYANVCVALLIIRKKKYSPPPPLVILSAHCTNSGYLLLVLIFSS